MLPDDINGESLTGWAKIAGPMTVLLAALVQGARRIFERNKAVAFDSAAIGRIDSNLLVLLESQQTQNSRQERMEKKLDGLVETVERHERWISGAETGERLDAHL